MKRMSINDVEFEVKKKDSITFYSRDLFRELTDCYNRPSDRKKAIWNENPIDDTFTNTVIETRIDSLVNEMLK